MPTLYGLFRKYGNEWLLSKEEIFDCYNEIENYKNSLISEGEIEDNMKIEKLY